MNELDPANTLKRNIFKIILILTLYLLECSRTYSHSEINTQLMSFFGGIWNPGGGPLLEGLRQVVNNV